RTLLDGLYWVCCAACQRDGTLTVPVAKHEGEDMLNHVREVATALVLSAALYGVGNCQPLPQWGISEIYSNADGSVQFIVVEITRDGPSLAGQTLIASNGSTQKRYTFPTDVPYDIFRKESSQYFLVGTQGFADLNFFVKPDFVLPNGFLFATEGPLGLSVTLGASGFYYSALPTDGFDALCNDGTFSGGEVFGCVASVANNGGASGAFVLATGPVAMIEYYDAALDEYFLTAYPYELQLLDQALQFGWRRTGHSLAA